MIPADFNNYLDILYKTFGPESENDDLKYNLFDSYDRYIYNKCMISIAKYAGDMANYKIPYVNNYKFFLDDPDYSRASYDIVNKTSVERFILLCLDVSLKRYDFSQVHQIEDFQEAMTKVNINYDNKGPAFQAVRSVTEKYQGEEQISHKYIYELYTILITEYLSRKSDIELTSPLPENTAVLLNSKNIFTPYEGYITTHCFFEKYMRTEEQRNIDYPFVYNCRSAEKRYSYRKACALLYVSECETDVYRGIENTLRSIYKNVGLTRTGTTLSEDDLAMYVIWKMLFRSSDSTLDDYLKFNKVVNENINPTQIHKTSSIENLNDNNTLCENRWVDDNSATIYESIIRGSVADNYHGIDLTEIWFDILDELIIIFDRNIENGFLTDLLTQAYQILPEDIEANVDILSEYKYDRDRYDFITGLSTMVCVYGDIVRAYPKFRQCCHPVAYHEIKPMNFRDITPEFVKENQLWRLLCETEPETKQKIYKLENSIINTLPQICKAIDTICQNKTYTLRQHYATIWLYKNGGDIEITFPKGYQKKTNLPNTLSAIMRCNNNKKRTNTNMWYNLISITNFVEAYRQFMVAPEAYKLKLEIYLSAYTELYDFINERFIQCNKTPSYTIKALEHILLQTKNKVTNIADSKKNNKISKKNPLFLLF